MRKLIVFLALLMLFTSCEIRETSNGSSNNSSSQDIPGVDEIKNVEMFGQDYSDIYTENVQGKLTGFLARPKKAGTYPAVVMIHEWWGLNENIIEMAKILAKEGYIVFAIDLYDGEVAKDSARAGQLASAVRNDQEEAVGKMKDAVKFLRETENATKVASLGWCFGGGESLQLSLNEKLDATVIYYGSLVTDVEKLKSIDWPILGIFGEKDASIPVATVKEFKGNLDALKIENEVYIYPGVGHAFANPSGANYAKEETIDAWEKTVDFLDRELKG